MGLERTIPEKRPHLVGGLYDIKPRPCHLHNYILPDAFAQVIRDTKVAIASKYE